MDDDIFEYEDELDCEVTIFDGAHMTCDMADEEVLEVVLAEAGIQDAAPLDTAAPTLRHQPATHKRDKPLNLVIVLEESLGSQYVGSLGGADLTPEFDRLGERVEVLDPDLFDQGVGQNP